MRIAIFGGAFDPFHTEHRKIIVSCKKELSIDKVVVVPSFSPPHKNSPMSDFNDRFSMVIAGTADLDYVIVDKIEKERNTENPTYKVLPLLKEKYPCDELYFVIGGDSMIHFHTWIKPDIITKYATLAVISRDGYNGLNEAIANAKKHYGAKIILLNAEGEEVSSSIIKASIELGLDTQYLQKQVREIIYKRKLYKRYNDIVNKLRSNISEKTFQHSCSTVIYAMKFVSILNLDYEKVFLSCLLHDCAKNLNVEMKGVPSPVIHQFIGAETTKNEYGIIDEEILDAIKYHTTGKEEMSVLGKLVFVADMLEPLRNFDNVQMLRKEIEKDFENGFFLCLNSSYNKIAKEKNSVYPLTKRCIEYYTDIRNQSEFKEKDNDTQRT